MTFRTILGCVNPYVNVFVRAVDHLTPNHVEEVPICIIAGHTLGNGDVRCYIPTTNEVAMIIPGELREVGNRDVIVQRRYGGGLQRMNEVAPSYDPWQYPLLFLVGEDGWFENLQLQNNRDGACTNVSMAAYYAQKVHFSGKLFVLHFSGHLFNSISLTLLLRQSRTLFTFWC